MMLTIIDMSCSPAIIGVDGKALSILDDSAAYCNGPAKKGLAV